MNKGATNANTEPDSGKAAEDKEMHEAFMNWCRERDHFPTEELEEMYRLSVEKSRSDWNARQLSRDRLKNYASHKTLAPRDTGIFGIETSEGKVRTDEIVCADGTVTRVTHVAACPCHHRTICPNGAPAVFQDFKGVAMAAKQ